MALLIHGDASFAGQGVVQETLNLSQLPGYTVGGTVHVIVNNQIGFTTPPGRRPLQHLCHRRRPMLQIPIFHVNGEDPEAVAQVVRLAMDFRREFHRDVFIDMFGYRRLGHNEGDEPSFTQPVLYRAIERRKSVREGYLDHLLSLGGLTREEAGRNRRAAATKPWNGNCPHAQAAKPAPGGGIAAGRLGAALHGGPEKSAEDPAPESRRAGLRNCCSKQTELPEDFHPHPKIKKFLESRRKMAAGRAAVGLVGGRGAGLRQPERAKAFACG